jgi:hypothetical protein
MQCPSNVSQCMVCVEDAYVNVPTPLDPKHWKTTARLSPSYACLLLPTESSKHEIIIRFDANQTNKSSQCQSQQFDLSENMCWQLHFISTDPVSASATACACIVCSMRRHPIRASAMVALMLAKMGAMKESRYSIGVRINLRDLLITDKRITERRVHYLIVEYCLMCRFLHIPPRTTYEV